MTQPSLVKNSKNASVELIAEQLKGIAVKGHINEFEMFYKAHSFDDAEIEQVAIAAAGYGRIAVLEYLEPFNSNIEQLHLIQSGISGDRAATVRYFEERDVQTLTPGNISIAVQHDSARVMGHWIDHVEIEDPVAVANQALHYNAVFCLCMLLQLDIVRNDADLICRIKHAQSPVRDLIPGNDTEIQGAEIVLAPDQYNYSYKTPSEHINIQHTTIRFLLYRRIMRMFFTRS